MNPWSYLTVWTTSVAYVRARWDAKGMNSILQNVIVLNATEDVTLEFSLCLLPRNHYLSFKVTPRRLVRAIDLHWSGIIYSNKTNIFGRRALGAYTSSWNWGENWGRVQVNCAYRLGHNTTWAKVMIERTCRSNDTTAILLWNRNDTYHINNAGWW